MNQTTINADALRDVLVALVGEQLTATINVAYVIVDKAEKRGQEAGWQEGFLYGRAQGQDEGYEACEQDQTWVDAAIEDAEAETAWIDWPVTLNEAPSDDDQPDLSPLYTDEQVEKYSDEDADPVIEACNAIHSLPMSQRLA